MGSGFEIELLFPADSVMIDFSAMNKLDENGEKAGLWYQIYVADEFDGHCEGVGSHEVYSFHEIATSAAVIIKTYQKGVLEGPVYYYDLESIENEKAVVSLEGIGEYKDNRKSGIWCFFYHPSVSSFTLTNIRENIQFLSQQPRQWDGHLVYEAFCTYYTKDFRIRKQEWILLFEEEDIMLPENVFCIEEDP